jgi:type VI secretion system secreted protein VgrG
LPEERLLELTTPLGEGKLLLQSFAGSEAVSRLFEFHLDLLSEDSSISFEDIVGQRVTIAVRLADDNQRFINGFVSRFAQSGRDKRYTHYQAEVVPWLWFLTRSADCRIFQNKKAPDIITDVFKKLGFTDFKQSLQGSFDTLEYCVQYRETAFNFISRLMEEFGIFYYFEHDDSKHTLVLGDAPSVHQPVPHQAKARYDQVAGNLEEEDLITSWEAAQELRPGKYSQTDYNFETPNTSLMVNESSIVNVGGNSKYEIYDYPGDYLNKGQGSALAKVRMQEEEATHLVMRGKSKCRAFTPGYRCSLEDFYRSDMNESYVLLEVRHTASEGGRYTREPDAVPASYDNEFSCIPQSVPFRPVRTTRKPFVQGPQTAVVVGKSGEEIWVDKYGRIKVQFYWDREGKKDESSSCWIRVSQSWAGKSWGAMAIPRIGQEVIVDFLEGDPDRPIITGCVYNADQMPPYALPGEQTKMLIKSNSSKGGGGFNELRFEDKKDSEQIFIHGEKDLDVRIKKDRREWIGQDRHLIVKRDKVDQIERDLQVKINRDKVESLSRDHHLSINGKQAIKVTGSHSLAVTGDGNEQFSANYSKQVTANCYIKGMNVVVEGMTGLTIKVGGSYVSLNPAGVQITGPMVLINSGGAALSGSAGALVSPTSAIAAAVADDAVAGGKSQAPAGAGSDAAGSSASAAASPSPPPDAPTHDPNAEENKDKTHWIEVELVDEAGKPVAGRPFEIKLPDGSYYTGTTDDKGKGKVENIDPGSCDISFPDLDQDAWEPA